MDETRQMDVDSTIGSPAMRMTLSHEGQHRPLHSFDTLKLSFFLNQRARLWMTIVLLTSLVLLSACAPTHSISAPSCNHPINQRLDASTIRVEGNLRSFIVAGCADHLNAKGLPLILAFHGGGQELHNIRGTGFIDYTGLASAPAVVVFPEGNPSRNGHSWINAFPWMMSNPPDDFALIEQILVEIQRRKDIPHVNLERIFAIGKSDGAGFAMALACKSLKTYHLAGVGLVSGAYFGIGSVFAFGTSSDQICLPVEPIPILMIHGTADSVMPFNGQHFLNPKALAHRHDYWSQIDPAVHGQSSNTFTADIPLYAEAIARDPEGCQDSQVKPIHRSSIETTWTGCKAPFRTIWVKEGNHVWEGRQHSGPESGTSPNMDFDATIKILEYFGVYP